MAVICAGYDGDISLPSSSNFIWIIIIGIGGLLAHFCITKALQLAPATVVTPIDFCRLPMKPTKMEIILIFVRRSPNKNGAASITHNGTENSNAKSCANGIRVRA